MWTLACIALAFQCFPCVYFSENLILGIVAQMEVGIEDCLHIEFEYNKARYHLKDSVIGKIYFLLVSTLSQLPFR